MPDAARSEDASALGLTAGADASDDARRFTSLYRDHHGRVHDFACRRVGVDLAQEVVAETFLVAWRRIDDMPLAAVPWLYRIALYEIANLRRRQVKSSRLHLALVARGQGTGEAPDPVEFSELARAVAIAFETLKPRDQEILRLAAWEQLTTAEGAAVLHCSVSAYRMRLHRARIRLAAKSAARDALPAHPHDVAGRASARARAVAPGHAPLRATEFLL